MPREHWNHRLDFFLTAVGYSVGIGDLWRFPYLVMKNGGGAFLIPVLIFTILVAIPVAYVEMFMGQFAQKGAVTAWDVAPLFRGIGYGTVISNYIFATYFAVLLSWCVYYLFSSFQAILPWTTCNGWWNTEMCAMETVTVATNGTTNTTYLLLETSVSDGNFSVSKIQRNNKTNFSDFHLMSDKGRTPTSPVEEFWLRNNLRISSGLEEMGDMNWPQVGCLFLIDIVCFFIIFKGIKYTGKIVYFTVLTPFVLLTIFLIRCSLLPGATDGMLYYVSPDITKLADIKIWTEACLQVFISTGLGSGGLITFASYNPLHNNCLWDAVLLCFTDIFTGFYAGLVLFSVIGHVAKVKGVSISSFDSSGIGLGFLAYPEGANNLPLSQLWCVVFFLTCFFLGVDTLFAIYEVVSTAVRDELPAMFSGSMRKNLLNVGVVMLAFVLGLPLLTQGGIYLLTLVDWYGSTLSITIFGLLECVIMAFIYGVSKMDKDVMTMSGKGVPLVIKMSLYSVTPLLLLVMVVSSVVTYTPPHYEGYTFPLWAIALGWMITGASLVPLPAIMIYKISTTTGTLAQRVKELTGPRGVWKEALDQSSREALQQIMDNQMSLETKSVV